MEKTKKCSKCGEVKPLSEFNKSRNKRDGHSCYCRVCARIIRCKYAQENREQIRTRQSEKRLQANPESVSKYRLQKELKIHGLKKCACCENIKPLSEFHRDKHKFKPICRTCLKESRCRAYFQAYYQNNIDKFRNYGTRYRENNRDRVRIYHRVYMRESAAMLKDSYVLKILKQSGFSTSDITPDLIELKRQQLKLERAYRLLNKEINNQNK